MTAKPKLPEICKEAFTKAREKRGLSTQDLGGMACLSHHQIEQIEKGESAYFYGAQNKCTAAKKVAKILELSDEEAFDFGATSSQKLTIEKIEIPNAESKQDELNQSSVQKSTAKKVAAEAKDLVEEAQSLTLAIEETPQPGKKVEPKKVASKEIPFPSATAISRSTSSRKSFLWLGALAVLVFSVIGLRTLFFADQPEEIVIVKEEIIEPAAPASTAAPVEQASVPAAVAGTDSSGACPAEGVAVNYRPDVPRKSADVVYVQAKSQQVICVIDVSGKAQNKLLEPGVGASFYGKPPFKVLTAGLNQVDVFFQGAKVRLSNLNTKTLVLEAAEVVSSPIDRTDSQLR